MFVEAYLRELRRARYRPAACAGYVRDCVVHARESAYRNADGVRSILVNGIGFFILFLGLAFALAVFIDESVAYRLILHQGTAVAIGTIWILVHVGLLRDGDARPLPRIGVPNQLSFFRLLMIPTIHLFIVEGLLWLAFSAYALAAVSDVLDGWVARRVGPRTRLGLVLDPIVDVGYVIGIFTAFHRIGWIPSWLLAIIALRYTLLFGGSTALYLIRARVKIQPTAFGRISGVVISAMMFLLFALVLVADVDPSSGLWRVMIAGLGFLFASACVQLVVIGLHNLRDAG